MSHYEFLGAMFAPELQERAERAEHKYRNLEHHIARNMPRVFPLYATPGLFEMRYTFSMDELRRAQSKGPEELSNAVATIARCVVGQVVEALERY